MPGYIRKILQSDGEVRTNFRTMPDGRKKRYSICPNQTEGMLPVIRQLLEQDKSVEWAYLCHPSVRHCSKLPKEGMHPFLRSHGHHY